MIVAEPGHWIAYPWWSDPLEEPDYAAHVDIHNKPGYDPCELFWGWPPGSVSRNAARVRGTHGRTGPGREIAWASTIVDQEPAAGQEEGFDDGFLPILCGGYAIARHVGGHGASRRASTSRPPGPVPVTIVGEDTSGKQRGQGIE